MSSGKRYIMSVGFFTELPENEPEGTMCWVQDDQRMMIFNGSLWLVVAGSATGQIHIYVDGAARAIASDMHQGDLGYAIIEKTMLVYDGTAWIPIAP